MKPFDIELAKANHPVQTRDGRPARIVCYDRKTNTEYKLIVLVQNGDREETYFYSECGNINQGEEYHHLNLVMAPVKKEGWINIYKTQEVGYIYETEAEALENANVGLKATIKIEWEE